MMYDVQPCSAGMVKSGPRDSKSTTSSVPSYLLSVLLRMILVKPRGAAGELETAAFGDVVANAINTSRSIAAGSTELQTARDRCVDAIVSLVRGDGRLGGAHDVPHMRSAFCP